MNDKRKGVETATTLGLTKYVHVLFFGGALVIGWLLVKVIETIWTWLNLQYTPIPPTNGWIAMAIGGAAAASLGIYLWRHPKVNRLSMEIIVELSKVTWPTRKELSASTTVVIILSIIASIILGLFDFFWAAVTDFILL